MAKEALMTGVEIEETLSQVYEQHRLMQEQHAALVQKVADSAFKALRAENRRLEQELAVLRDCVARHSVRTPVALSEGPGHEGTPHLPGMVDQKAWESGPPPEGRKMSITKSSSRAWEGDKKQESRERRRLRAMFGLDNSMAEAVPLDKVVEVVSSRIAGGVSQSWVLGALAAIEAARDALAFSSTEFQGPWLMETSFSIEGLVELMGPDAQLLLTQVVPAAQEAVSDLVNALKMSTVEEVVGEAARGSTPPPLVKIVTQGWRYSPDHIVNGAVITAVLLNILAMGISIDNDPNHLGWFLFETACVMVFVVEVFYKICANSIRHYLFGPFGMWNIMDLIVTILSLLDLGVSLWGMTSEDADMMESKVSGLARPIVMLRTVRVIRIVRLAKLLHAPLLRDLANMLVGFAIGLPAMIWVLAVFCFVLYVIALIFRLVLGPAPGQDLMYAGGCGLADDWVNYDHPTCKIHWMYGEEFFGTVSSSMFTVFRFMLGDYSTRGGKSMIIAMSAGYGIVFELVFVSFMIIVIFGLFNIITAIFVDSTTAGLKHNDVKRKYAQQYEREYVKGKLRALLERIYELHMEKLRGRARISLQESMDFGAFAIEEEEFVQIMGDPVVKDIAEGLDVDINNPAGLFSTFDANNDGTVTMLEMAIVLLRLRGDPHKTDVIECVVSLRHLQARFDRLDSRLKHVFDAIQDGGGGANAFAATRSLPAGRVSARPRGGTLWS